MIIDEVGSGRDINDSRSDLAACALTRRKWRRRAQQAIHSDVVLTPTTSDRILRLYEADPTSKGNVAANLAEFPTSLTLRGSFPDFDFLTTSAEVTNFLKSCGDRITVLKLKACTIMDITELLTFIGKFPSLESLIIWQCDIAPQYFAVQAPHRGDIPLALPSLKRLEFITLWEQTEFAHWLSHLLDLKISKLTWTYILDRELRTSPGSAVFSAIGPALKELSLCMVWRPSRISTCSVLISRKQRSYIINILVTTTRLTNGARPPDRTGLPGPLEEHKHRTPDNTARAFWMDASWSSSVGAFQHEISSAGNAHDIHLR